MFIITRKSILASFLIFRRQNYNIIHHLFLLCGMFRQQPDFPHRKKRQSAGFYTFAAVVLYAILNFRLCSNLN